MAKTSEDTRTGRPKAQDAPVTLEQILDAAFRAFATYGYDGVAVRTLNRELGVSHNLIHQRFGSKQGLWYAAVDRAFSQQVTQLATAFDPTLADPLDQLNYAIRRFVRYSAERPELLGLMNIEARVDSERLDYIYDNYIAPALGPLGRLLDHLRENGRIRPISLRALFFLIAHGAAAPFTLAPLARHFDNTDPLDPNQVAEHAALTADLITSGLRLNPPGR
jgi:TetR/AcrR family transcriptional regulator